MVFLRRCLDVDSSLDPVWRLARDLGITGVELVAREVAPGIRALGRPLGHPHRLGLVGRAPLQGLERARILDHPLRLGLVGLGRDRLCHGRIPGRRLCPTLKSLGKEITAQ